ncbi:MAG: transcriptional regulator [Bacillota bacterium]|jgi:transcriptional regulator with PAS, ATPase and Fis domain|nr:transcriptional regulator [Bacillota bacterium]
MDQVLAIIKICEKINKALPAIKEPAAEKLLHEIQSDLKVFLDKGIDFKEVVDSLDDSIFITDGEGKVLYVNPAYEQNTGILPGEVLFRYVQEILDEGKLFTGGATMDVIETGKKAFRLSTIIKNDPPRVGYAVGVPITDENDKLKQVVVSSRPILTLKALQEDYERFLEEVKMIQEPVNIRIIPNSDTSDLTKRMIGSSETIKKVWNLIGLIADTDATVLITGESGVGKEVVADEIYRRSNRNQKPFIKVNCASIPSNLLESELFGYEKGAFSGASSSGKQGLFELANSGILLLDEIGDMPMDLQAKLLRAIQSREITRVGGTKVIPLDIRIIALTNSDLKQKIKEGSFRSDLYYRLSVIPIHLDPLRAHTEDIEDLSRYFIEIYSHKHKRTINLTQKNISLMKLYSWPGNIRELENVIEYLVICCSGTAEVEDNMLKGILGISGTEKSANDAFDLTKSVEQFEKQQIEKVLSIASNLREAGEMLNVNASTISRKIKQYGIEYPRTK